MFDVVVVVVVVLGVDVTGVVGVEVVTGTEVVVGTEIEPLPFPPELGGIAVAVYVTVPAPWHRVDVAPIVKTGVPTVGVIVTVCVAVAGPLHPAALAVMALVPLQPET